MLFSSIRIEQKSEIWSFIELKTQSVLYGGTDVQVVEQPDAIKTYLVRWNGVKIDLTQLAKLRWIERKQTPELCRIFGQRRTAIRQRLRTLRKCGISELNLSQEERKLIQKQMKLEEKSYGGKQ
jgi:hypothetical protein